MNTDVYEEAFGAFNHIVTKRKLTEGLAGQLFYLTQAVRESNSPQEKRWTDRIAPCSFQTVALAIGNQ